jgi:hypothetical protein
LPYPSPNQIPGVVIEAIPVAVPERSIASIARAGVQSFQFGGRTFADLIALSHPGDAKW